jgi:HSP20 family molecular chaperone IbpA
MWSAASVRSHDPFEVKDQTVDAKFKDGVLTIHLPKPAELQGAVRKIDAKSV